MRQWDARADDEIQGTGGTPFMPYLRKHRRTTFETLVPTAGAEESTEAAAASGAAVPRGEGSAPEKG